MTYSLERHTVFSNGWLTWWMPEPLTGLISGLLSWRTAYYVYWVADCLGERLTDWLADSVSEQFSAVGQLSSNCAFSSLLVCTLGFRYGRFKSQPLNTISQQFFADHSLQNLAFLIHWSLLSTIITHPTAVRNNVRKVNFRCQGEEMRASMYT